MELENCKKKVQIFHIVNTVTVCFLLLASVLSLVFIKKTDVEPVMFFVSELSILFSVFSIVLGCVLPKVKEGYYMPEEMDPKDKKAFAGGLYRNWNFVAFLIVAVFLAPATFTGAGLCFSKHYSLAGQAHLAAGVLWLLLTVGSGMWTYYDTCAADLEQNGFVQRGLGKRVARNFKIGILTVVLIFAVGFLITFIRMKMEGKIIPTVDTDKISQQLEQMQDAISQIPSEDLGDQQEFKNIAEALHNIKQSHSEGKMYYIIKYLHNGDMNIVTWDDVSEDVFVDSFEVLENDRLKRTKAFVSSAILKQDVEGKQNGVVE